MNVASRIPSQLISSSVRRRARLVVQRRQKHVTTTADQTSQDVISVPISTEAKEVREVRIPVPWGHIAGKWWGPSDTQPVLALHDWQDNAGTFDTLLPLLDNVATTGVLAVDLVGHGRSSHFPAGHCYHYIDQVINVKRIAKHYGWREKLILLGHGVGSSLAFTYSGYFPDEVDVFISIDGTRGSVRIDDRSLAEDIGTLLDAYIATEGKPPGTSPSYDYEDVLSTHVQDRYSYLSRASCEVLLERDLVRCDEDKCKICKDLSCLKFDALTFNKEAFIYAIAERVTCAVLNVRATAGVTVGGYREKVYLKTLEILEKTSRRYKHHDVEGHHHVHLSNTRTVADVINKFMATKTVSSG